MVRGDRFQHHRGAVFANLPNRIVAWILRFISQPFGARHCSPAYALTKHCAQLLLEPSETRDRLTAGLYLGKHDEGLAWLERAFALAIENEPIAKKLQDARIHDWRAAKKSGLITDIESERMAAQAEVVAKVVAVDDFAAHQDENQHSTEHVHPQTANLLRVGVGRRREPEKP
jgi:acyl-CoA dehydrogenase